jgi:hypothetical protein
LLDEKDVRYRDPGAWESRDLQEEIRSFVKSLPAAERKPDPMSQEAYFYGFRNFAHFHGARHIDIRTPKVEARRSAGYRKGP